MRVNARCWITWIEAHYRHLLLASDEGFVWGVEFSCLQVGHSRQVQTATAGSGLADKQILAHRNFAECFAGKRLMMVQEGLRKRSLHTKQLEMASQNLDTEELAI